jgi:hypothetical protein
VVRLEGVQVFYAPVLGWVEAIDRDADLTHRVLSALETRVEHLAPLPARLESGVKAYALLMAPNTLLNDVQQWQ